ncbi:MAG: PorT family protein [Rikenellaceae bacterium]|nr:PorT family protein [Rikenellaceae bacterium]
MKKLLLVLVSLSALSIVTVNAQKKPVEFGVRAGLNISNFWDHDYETSVLLGANAGVFMDIKIVNNFYIQPGLSYSRKGARFKGNYGNTFDCKLEYIDMPILAGYIFEFPKISLDIHSGFFLAYGVAGSYSNGISGSPFKDPFNRFDMGLSEGVAVGFNDFYIGILCHLGLMDIGSSRYYDVFSNATVSFNVAYRF